MSPRVAVVTGAASGMGRVAAIRWARAGLSVAAVDVQADMVKELERDVPGITAFYCDVADEAAVRATATTIRERLGSIDRLANVAGICRAGKTGVLAAGAFRRVMEINYIGTVNWVDAVLPAMRERGSGEILNWSSIAGYVPTPGLNAYGATKFAVHGYTEALALETHKDGIRVICVCPPGVDTPLYSNLVEATSLGPRISKVMKPIPPERVIDAVDRALAGRGTLVFVGGPARAIHLLRRFAPNTTNRLFAQIYGL